MAGQTVSFKPSTFVAGGALISDIDVTWAEVRFAEFDYNGKIPVPIPTIMAKLVDDDGVETIQYWSVGSSDDWSPSEDGKKLIAASGATVIKDSCNGAILMNSIVNAGFPEDKMNDNDITATFQGMKTHVIRQAAPKRNIVKEPRADGRVYEDTVLVVSKIIALPWEKKGVAAKGAAKPQSAGATSGDGDELSTKAVGLVMEILATEGKPVPKQQLVTKVFQAVKSDPDRNKLVQLVHSDQFLGNGPWGYEGGVVSAG